MFNFSVCRLVKTVSRAGPQNVMFTACFADEATAVHNETFIDRSTIEWVQCACASTMKFQSSFFKLFIKHLRRSIYPVLVSN